MITEQNIGNFSQCFNCKIECFGVVYGVSMAFFEKEKKWNHMVFAKSINSTSGKRALFYIFCLSCWKELAGDRYSFDTAKAFEHKIT